jgi:ABC-type antimicrobial peptide transport system permease subunit
MEISLSSVDEEVGERLSVLPEVEETAAMLQGFTQTDGSTFFFVFGHPEDSYMLDRYQIVEGSSLYSPEARRLRGTPLILGKSAAEVLNKTVDETIRITGSSYRIVGIYETGDPLEDGGAVLELAEAQTLLGKPRTVSLYYIKLKAPEMQDQLAEKVERFWPDLLLSTTDDFGNQQLLTDMLDGFVWAIAGMAILIGGVGMMNAQLMSVTERTREIGLLRAVGWSRRRVMALILSESVVVSLLGGAAGLLLSWLVLLSISEWAQVFGLTLDLSLVGQAAIVALVLGMAGGLYPAWRASRLMPIEAIRYEGGTAGGGARRLPIGGMAFQSLWQRTTRTLLTVSAIGLTVGTIMALEAVLRGAAAVITDLGFSSQAQIMVRQADIADTSLSAIDERVGDAIAALPEVEAVSGMVMSAMMLPDQGSFLILFGYSPRELAIQRFEVAEGRPINGNHQIMLGRIMSDALGKDVGETIEVGGNRFRVTGIYESGVSYEEIGGVVTLRDAQNFAGRPRKVTMYQVKVHDPPEAAAVVEEINNRFPEAHASLTGEFAEQMPDFETADVMINTISFMAIAVGGLVVLNTMLMAVLERTREVGVLRALGWRRRQVLGLILREGVLIGLLGGIAGIVFAFTLTALIGMAPLIGGVMEVIWGADIFVRAIGIALLLGLLGGLYPAYRATRMQPVEALRYE